MVRKGGLEPPRYYPPDPKSGASANSATLAGRLYCNRAVFSQKYKPSLSGAGFFKIAGVPCCGNFLRGGRSGDFLGLWAFLSLSDLKLYVVSFLETAVAFR